MEEIYKGLSSFGFPVVVAMFLLLRIEKKLENFTDTIGGKMDSLGDKIDELNTNIKVLSAKRCK